MAFDQAIADSLSLTGRSVTLVNQSAQTDNSGNPKRDSYNNIKWDSKTTTDTTAELVYRGSKQFSHRADGIDKDIDVIAWLSSDDSSNVTTGEDDDATRATRIKANGERYVVRDVFDDADGQLRCHGMKEDQ